MTRPRRPTGKGFLALLLFAVGVLSVVDAPAQTELPKPAGRVILTVTGSIDKQPAEFDAAMLEAMGTGRIQTSTPWTEGRPIFEGIRVRDLLARVGAHGTTVTVVALNDYRMQIPLSDFTQYPAVLAMKMNGETLRIRDKGPLWLVYPQDDYPELQNKPTQAKWVWQIKEIRIE
jgi:hypothetical protein